MTPTWIAFGACCFWGLMFVFLGLIHWLNRRDPKKINKDLAEFIDRGDYTRALHYVETKLNGALIQDMYKALLKPAEEGNMHRLMLVCEEQRTAIQRTEDRLTHGGWLILRYAFSLAIWACFAYSVYTLHPTNWNAWWLALWLVLAALGGWVAQRAQGLYNGYEEALVAVRNRILLQKGYMPPELTPYRLSPLQLAEWRKGINEIEMDVLAGKDWKEATEAQRERVLEIYEHRVQHPDEAPPPSGRLSLLRWEGDAER